MSGQGEEEETPIKFALKIIVKAFKNHLSFSLGLTAVGEGDETMAEIYDYFRKHFGARKIVKTALAME